MPLGSLPVPPPALALVAGGLQYALSRRSASTALSRTAAGIVAGASGALAAVSASRFLQARTTVDPHAPERASTLVTDGVNSWTRNPMYLGMTGVLVAHAILRRSALALLPAAGFAAVLDRTQIRAEEQALGDRFGEEYDTYCSRVPRWIGRRRRDGTG